MITYKNSWKMLYDHKGVIEKHNRVSFKLYSENKKFPRILYTHAFTAVTIIVILSKFYNPCNESAAVYLKFSQYSSRHLADSLI